MTDNFLKGGAAINVLARHYGVDTEVVDVGVDYEFAAPRGLRNYKIRRGTANFARGPAMTRDEAVRSVELGIELVREAAAKNIFLLGAGDMGIGNTSSATAILMRFDGRCARPTLPGAARESTTQHWREKSLRSKEASIVTVPMPMIPSTFSPRLAAWKLAPSMGVILGAAALRVPMVLDGFISGAAALLAQRFTPHVRDILFASHLSAETGHALMLDELKLVPVLDLQMRLGEGTGACLLMGLIEASVKIMGEMATFESAGVKEKLS